MGALLRKSIEPIAQAHLIQLMTSTMKFLVPLDKKVHSLCEDVSYESHVTCVYGNKHVMRLLAKRGELLMLIKVQRGLLSKGR